MKVKQGEFVKDTAHALVTIEKAKLNVWRRNTHDNNLDKVIIQPTYAYMYVRLPHQHIHVKGRLCI